MTSFNRRDLLLGSLAAALPAPAVYGVPAQWPHVRSLYERAGFTPDGATNVLTGLGGILEVRYRRPLELEL